MAETTILTKDNGEWIQMYKCTGQSYYIDEKMCDGRQERGNRQCARCTLRKGGKNDPRRRET